MMRFALLMSLTAVLAGSAMADSLAVGASTTPTLLGALPSGLTLLASGSTPFTLTGPGVTATGTAMAWVYQTAGGTLDFAYQIGNNASSTDLVDTLSMSAFGGFTTDVDYVSSAGENAPTSTSRPSSGVVDFYFFPNDIVARDTSDLVLIETNATSFAAGNLSLIDSGVTSVAAFEPSGTPTTPVPEPSSLLLLCSGLLVLMGRSTRPRVKA